MLRKLLFILLCAAACSTMLMNPAQAGGSVSYKYDANNRLIEIAFQKDGKNYKTTFVYDRNGNLISRATKAIL